MTYALITGASKGLGRYLAITLSDNGHNLIIHGRDKKSLEKVAKACNNCDVIVGDIRHEDTIERLYNAAKRRNIDILVNNAGIYSNKDFGQESFEESYELLDTNLLSPIRLIKKIYPIFKKKKSGLIININSLAGLKGNPSECSYCAGKYGLRGFTNSLREYAIRDGIIVTDIYLGAMNTQMTKGRKDQDKCIDPHEASEIIVDLCKNYRTVKIDEIILTRRLK